jgi:predicted RNA-binding Zn ribbon-like protein
VSQTEAEKLAKKTLPPSQEGEPAPGELELVRGFLNTKELDPNREELTDPAALDAWMKGRGVPVEEAATADDVDRAVSFREALRSLALANSGWELEPEALERIRSAASESTLRAWVDDKGEMVIAPSCDGVDALIARVLSAVATAQETGEWSRLKACASGECMWAFYDQSRNRSRHWCSMEVCGNRAKTRNYRARKSG